MSNEDTARKIAGHLRRGLERIDSHTAQRLQAARNAALDRYNPRSVYEMAWAGAGSRSGYARYFNFRYLFSTAALVLVVIGGGLYWQNVQYYAQINRQANEFAELDAGLLTDDLPIPAYLDNGLDSWLKRSSQ